MFLALSGFAIELAGAGELRTFNMVEGPPILVELEDVTPGRANYTRGGIKEASRLSDFAPGDQEYLREWMRKNRSIYDWPSLHGNWHDGSTPEKLPTTQLPILWRSKIGAGDAAVAVGFEKAVTCGVVGGEFFVTAFDLEKGGISWKKSYAVSPESRALATPTITAVGLNVFTRGPGNRYDCWDLKNGASVWADSIQAKFPDADLRAGANGSPLLVQESLFIEVGPPAYSLVRLAPKNGIEKWRIGKYGSRGATPVFAEIGKRKLVVCHNQHGLVGRDAKSGSRIVQMQWEQDGHSSALMIPDGRVFLTSPKSCVMVRIDGRKVETIWENQELCSEFVKPIYHKEALFGFGGNALVCLDATSGEKRWEVPDVVAGNLIRAGEHLLIQSGKSGELIVADANPEKYSERSRIKVFAGGSKTIPVFANGRVFCRSENGDVTCLGVPKKIER